ncbi:hypothetical protein R6Q57_000030 [Mikania cordata]
MKLQFFSGWMQSKINNININGGQHNSRTASSAATHDQTLKQEPQNDENTLARGFLAIGTFGIIDDSPRENKEIQHHPDLSEFTPEDIEKLKKELTKLLSKKPAAANNEQGAADLPLDRFLNCPSSLEVDRRLSTTTINPDDKEEIDRTIRVILSRCKDIICKEKSKKSIRKKSNISFLLKKMFVCNNGIPPMPSLLHRQLPESKMERLLRAMLKNKINTQNSCRRPSSAKKLIDSCQSFKKGKGKLAIENDDEDANDGSKWVKTDSEYIVLEI